MSDSSSGNSREPASVESSGILAGLSRTRPQRASARRTASRAKEPSAASPRQPRQASARPLPRQTGATAPLPASKRTTAKARATAKKRASVKSGATAGERAPRQGFEAEPDSLGPVQPPGSTELVSSAAELAGELAKAGVTAGARVLRDFLSRLPG